MRLEHPTGRPKACPAHVADQAWRQRWPSVDSAVGGGYTYYKCGRPYFFTNPYPKQHSRLQREAALWRRSPHSLQMALRSNYMFARLGGPGSGWGYSIHAWRAESGSTRLYSGKSEGGGASGCAREPSRLEKTAEQTMYAWMQLLSHPFPGWVRCRRRAVRPAITRRHAL